VALHYIVNVLGSVAASCLSLFLLYIHLLAVARRWTYSGNAFPCFSVSAAFCHLCCTFQSPLAVEHIL